MSWNEHLKIKKRPAAKATKCQRGVKEHQETHARLILGGKGFKYKKRAGRALEGSIGREKKGVNTFLHQGENHWNREEGFSGT